MSDIDVTERSGKCRHRILDLDTRSVDSQLDDILQSAITARWAVVERDGSGDCILSILDVLHLPDPPRAINLSMMKPETKIHSHSQHPSIYISDMRSDVRGISRAGKNVPARITTKGEVASSVDTILSVCEVALHDGLEPVNVGILGKERG